MDAFLTLEMLDVRLEGMPKLPRLRFRQLLKSPEIWLRVHWPDLAKQPAGLLCCCGQRSPLAQHRQRV